MFEKYKKEIIILSIIVIIPLILIGLYYLFRNPVQNKTYSNNNMPYIDIVGKDINEINEYIEKIYSEYSKNSKTKINYKTNTYGDLVSVLIEIDEFQSNIKDYVKKFVSFNVKKDGTFVDDDTLANKFGFTLVDVVDQVENRLKYYYNEEVNEEYIDKDECDFNCYLSYARGINNILDELSLTVEDGKLVAYINMSKDDVSGDKEYFDNIKDYNPYKVIIDSTVE